MFRTTFRQRRSAERIEIFNDDSLFSKEHLFDALITKLSIANGEERERLRTALSKALESRDKSKVKDYLIKGAGVAAEKTVEVVIDKLFI